MLSQFMWQPDVVGIEQGNIHPSHMTYTEVTCRTRPTVLVARVLQVADAIGMLLSITLGDRRRAIGRAIVNQQQLPGPIGLSKNAQDCVIQILFCIIKSNKNADQRVAACHPTPSLIRSRTRPGVY